MNQVAKKETLSEAWLDSCLKLWDMAGEHGYDRSGITLWHALKHLYLTSVKSDYYAGRSAKGFDNQQVNNWDRIFEERRESQRKRRQGMKDGIAN